MTNHVSFKCWLGRIDEIVDPRKPAGPVRRKNFIRDDGTVRASQVIEYKFKTRLGNVVKVQFQVKGDDTYDVVFYVNDTLSDKAGKAGGATRDPEILPGVFHVVQEKADALKAKVITFSAWVGEGDTKVAKDVDVQPAQNRTLAELRRMGDVLRRFKVTMIPPSPARVALFQKFGKGVPEPLPDLDAPGLVRAIEELEAKIHSQRNLGITNEIDAFSDQFLRVDWNHFKIPTAPLLAALKDLQGSWMSHTSMGWANTKNRRANVYEKLVGRYFSGGWSVAKDGKYFTLTRAEIPYGETAKL